MKIEEIDAYELGPRELTQDEEEAAYRADLEYERMRDRDLLERLDPRRIDDRYRCPWDE